MLPFAKTSQVQHPFENYVVLALKCNVFVFSLHFLSVVPTAKPARQLTDLKEPTLIFGTHKLEISASLPSLPFLNF